MKKSRILALACLLLTCINVNAATYTSSGKREEPASLLTGTYYGGSLATWNLNGEKVYCVKPGASAPANGTAYVEKKLSSEKQAAFNYICSQIKGAPEAEQSVILKLTAVKLNMVSISSGSKVYAYKAFFNNDSQYAGSAFTDSQVRKMINDAASAKQNDKTAISATAENSTITIVSNGAEVTVSVGDGYTLTSGGNSGKELKLDGKESAYVVSVTANDGKCLNDVPVTVSYSKNDSTGNNAVAKYYEPANGGVQNGVSCNYSGDSNCDANFELDGDKCSQVIKLNTCTPDEPSEPDDPTDCTNINKPKVVTNNGDLSGEGLCKRDGDTVVQVEEGPTTAKKTVDEEIICLTQDEEKNATRVILGDSNSLCKVYCTENYKLILPGPDSKNDSFAENKDMFINAGGYFNITGEKKSEDTITCYGVNDFDAYETQVNGYREKVMNAANEYQKANAIEKANNNGYKETDPDTNVCTYTSAAGSYKKCEMLNGEITCSNVSLAGTTCTTASASTAETQYTNTYNDAKTKIEALNAEWDQCFNWNFDKLNEIIKDCTTTIDFKYGAAECENQKIEVIDTQISAVTDGEFGNTSYETKELNTGLCNKSMSDCTTKSNVKSQLVVSKQEIVKQTYEFKNNKFTIDLATNEVSCEAETDPSKGTWSDVLTGFPIKFDAIQGEYEYRYTYSGIGYNFSTLSSGNCTNGRLDDLIKTEKEYMCYFNVNSCNECEVSCDVNGVCEIDIPDCDGECKIACVGGGCIIDGYGGFMANFKVVSLNQDFAINSHAISSDPSVTLAYASTMPTLLTHDFDNWKGTKKGEETRQIITDSSHNGGENIYANEPEYSVTLSSSAIAKIKEYNENNDYGNASMNCKKVYASSYDYGICTSDFVHSTDKEFTFSYGELLSNVPANVTEYNGIKFESYGSIDIDKFTGPAWK